MDKHNKNEHERIRADQGRKAKRTLSALFLNLPGNICGSTKELI